SSILSSVGTGSSFCRPSRGPTSRTEMRCGKSLTGAPFVLCPLSLHSPPSPRRTASSVTAPVRRPFFGERSDALPPVGRHRGRAPGRILDLEARGQAHARAEPDGLLGGT